MMKAISLWQPWASAMRHEFKKNETRSWPTTHRGPLLICSAKRKPTLQECGDEETFQHAMQQPYGFGLVVVEMFDCVPTDYFQVLFPEKPYYLNAAEADLGDYSKGRFAWMTRNAKPLKEPIPIVGRQGLFFLTPEQESEVLRQIA